MATSGVMGAAAASEALGPGGIKRGQTRFVRWGKKMRPVFNRILSRYSLVGDTPTYDPALFPWTDRILAQLPAIQAEAKAIMRRESGFVRSC